VIAHDLYSALVVVVMPTNFVAPPWDLPSPSALARRLSQRFMREIFDQMLYTVR
jgi:hypothetical protein